MARGARLRSEMQEALLRDDFYPGYYSVSPRGKKLSPQEARISHAAELTAWRGGSPADLRRRVETIRRLVEDTGQALTPAERQQETQALIEILLERVGVP